MMDASVVTRPGALLARLGLAVAACLIGGALTAPPAAAQACVGTVDAPAGHVCGLALPAPPNTSRALYNYRGIPYARPPVGDLRFAAPRPPRPWTSLRRSTAFGAICPQDGTDTGDAEDCLFLNIWAPRRRRSGQAAAGHGLHPRRRLPVRRGLLADL
jgi:para-nitrobenzyl esterase